MDSTWYSCVRCRCGHHTTGAVPVTCPACPVMAALNAPSALRRAALLQELRAARELMRAVDALDHAPILQSAGVE